MNSIENELHGYIAGTERMSGYDGMEGDMSYFDDDDMSYFDDDDMSYATGGAGRAMNVSQPYVIQYVNTIAADVQAILFGYNDFFNVANFGNVATTTVTTLQGGTYARLISQSNNKPFKLGKLRFQSTTPAQLQQTLQINHVDANGNQYSTPLNLAIERDAYQQQPDIIDVNRAVTVDGNTFMTFTLIASATLVISLFPVEVLSSKAKLNGGASLNRARAPRLSGRNVAPVIIQTSQGVKGIAKG